MWEPKYFFVVYRIQGFYYAGLTALIRSLEGFVAAGAGFEPMQQSKCVCTTWRTPELPLLRIEKKD